MDTKKLIWVGVFVGSTLGGMLPLLWGGSAFSFSSLLLSALGAFAGIYVGYQISQRY